MTSRRLLAVVAWTSHSARVLEANGEEETIPADASAAFGINPDVTYWQMSHGAGGGEENIRNWTPTNAHQLWKQAATSSEVAHE